MSPAPLLGDSDGEWCAICLGYARPHDPLVAVVATDQSRRIEKRTKALPLSIHDIPCGNIRAHRQCSDQKPAFGVVPEVISRYLGSADRMTQEQLDKAAKIFHDQGFYSLSAALKDILLQKSSKRLSAAERAQTIERKIASLAGVRREKAKIPSLDDELRNYRNRPGIPLQEANLYANHGERARAAELLRHVEDLRSRMGRRDRRAIEPSYRMRVLQIRRSADAAYSAIQAAGQDPYMINTAYVLSGHVFAPVNPFRARTYFESILSQGQAASWLYRAESILGIASLMLHDHESPQEAYKLLVVAQYIYEVLRLQGTPHPDLHERLTWSNLTPGDLLRFDVQFSALSKNERFGLRQAAIIDSGIQDEILSSVLVLVPSRQSRTPDVSMFRRRSQVLVLGPDTSGRMNLLRRIVKCLARSGYRGFVVKDEPDFPEETNEQKVLRLSASSHFVIVESSVPAGQIDEIRMIVPERYVVAILHHEGTQATWMQSDYAIGFKFVKFFPYQSRTLCSTVDQACSWAEQSVVSKTQELLRLYPWRATASP